MNVHLFARLFATGHCAAAAGRAILEDFSSGVAGPAVLPFAMWIVPAPVQPLARHNHPSFRLEAPADIIPPSPKSACDVAHEYQQLLADMCTVEIFQAM